MGRLDLQETTSTHTNITHRRQDPCGFQPGDLAVEYLGSAIAKDRDDERRAQMDLEEDEMLRNRPVKAPWPIGRHASYAATAA